MTSYVSYVASGIQAITKNDRISQTTLDWKNDNNNKLEECARNTYIKINNMMLSEVTMDSCLVLSRVV